MKESSEDIKDIDSRLRVKPDPESVVKSACKNFILSFNYPKGDGENFRSFMEECHPDYVLM